MISSSRQSECFDPWAAAENPREPRFGLPPDSALNPNDDRQWLMLIDPKALTRSSISHLLAEGAPTKRRSEDLAVWSVASLEECLSMKADSAGGLALILLNLGTACAGESRARLEIGRLRDTFPGLPIVLMSDCEHPRHILAALHAGVRGYIPTALAPVQIIQAIRLVRAGGTFIPSSVLAEFGEWRGNGGAPAARNGDEPVATLDEFTPRQSQVFRLLRQGKSNKVIAYELGMQESTVKVHVRQIMRKLKATNRTHAAFIAAGMAETGVG
jgi:DNA-binding NarL/FixJ family response regulator